MSVLSKIQYKFQNIINKKKILKFKQFFFINKFINNNLICYLLKFVNIM